MKRITLFVSICLLASALGSEEKPPAAAPPPATIESLKAENEILKAQVETLQKLFANEQAACWNLDLMQSRYEAAAAQKKLADLTKKAAIPKESK